MNDNQPAHSSPLTAPQWRQIVNSAVDTAIISIDRQGLVTSWSAGATVIFGWSEAEMLGATLARIFPPGSDQLAREMADAAVSGRGGGAEGWRVRKDGSQIWAAGELTPIRGHGQIVGFVKIVRDRTTQRTVEETIRARGFKPRRFGPRFGN
jgi:PAS domain S-box-containing protein